MKERLKRYKKTVVAVVGTVATWAVTIAPLVPDNSKVARVLQVVIGIATILGVAVARNAPKYSNTPTVRSGPPPIR